MPRELTEAQFDAMCGVEHETPALSAGVIGIPGEPNVMRLKLVGRLGAEHAACINLYVWEATVLTHQQLLVDCTELDHVDEAGFEALVKCAACCAKNRSRMVLVGLSPELMDSMGRFDMDMHRFLETARDDAEALSMLAASRWHITLGSPGRRQEKGD